MASSENPFAARLDKLSSEVAPPGCWSRMAKFRKQRPILAVCLLVLTAGLLILGVLLCFRLLTGHNAAGVSSMSPTLARKVDGAADMIHNTGTKPAASLSAAPAQPNNKAFLAPRASTASTGASQAAAPTASTASTAAKPESTHNKNSSN